MAGQFVNCLRRQYPNNLDTLGTARSFCHRVRVGLLRLGSREVGVEIPEIMGFSQVQRLFEFRGGNPFGF